MASHVPALELRNVSYVGNGKTILHAINWTVQQGDHWALLGPNGSGKTTLLKIACGYLWPNAGGEVRRKGRVLSNLPELRKSIGWVTSTLPASLTPKKSRPQPLTLYSSRESLTVQARSSVCAN